jgi:CheY-like chemotaxis protein
MDEVTLRRATEPFFTTKGAGKGTGLGLSMVHGLAAQSGGALRIHSRVGVGTSVELWLPVSERVAVEPAWKSADPRDGQLPRRVLLVDDDPLIIAATADLLRDLGHVVVEANTAQQALELLADGLEVDLVVTDHAMPGMTGTDLARRIGDSWPEMPIILATGYAELPNGEAIDLPRLSKPYQQDDLAAAIARVLPPIDASRTIIPFDLARRA